MGTFNPTLRAGPDIRDRLRADESTRDWMAHLDAIGEPLFEIALPEVDELPSVLLKLSIPHEDINNLAALLPSEARSPEIWWLVRRSSYALIREMGAIGTPTSFPQLPESILGDMGRYFFVYVFVATLPHALAYHQKRNISEIDSWRTFAHLGRTMALNRQWHGTGGLELASWLAWHFRGIIFDLGRLHFERVKLSDRIGRAIAAAGLPYEPGDLALSIHIPGFSGPMTPSGCDASIARAKIFFSEHFAEEHYRIAICTSWLLDAQFADYLPDSSNIIQFQRRFRLECRPGVNDEDTILNVFGRLNPPLTDLPRRTALERAVIDHLLTGKHWRGGTGWFSL